MNWPSSKSSLKSLVLAAILILISAWPSTINRQIDKHTSSVLHQIRGPRALEIDALFIFLDSQDIADFGGWPITRDYYGYLVHALDSVGANTVVIDVLFPRMAQYDPGLDEATAGIFAIAGNIVLPKVFDNFEVANRQYPQASMATYPAPLYQDAAAGIGFANLGDHAGDGRIPLCADFDGQKSYSLAAEAAAHYLQASLATGAEANIDTVDNRSGELLSLWPSEIMPNYFGGSDNIQQIGFLQFLQQYPQLADSIDFSNKLVFVGLTAPGLPVLTSNPFQESFPASLLHLTVAENLIAGNAIRTMPIAIQLVLWLLLFSGGMWIFSRQWDRQSAIGLGLLTMIVLLTGYLSFSRLFYLAPIAYYFCYLLAVVVWALADSHYRKISARDSAAEELRSTIVAKSEALAEARASLQKLLSKVSDASGQRSELQAQLSEQQERVSSLERQLNDLQAGTTMASGPPAEFSGIIHAANGKMTELLQLVQRVSSEDIPVLISGETGTGKELIARAIHQKSARHRQPFVAVNCGAIAENLLESELFGHEKGSFTGAHARRRGRFELADGGTIFLDEVTETTLSFQARLLRVLQEGTFERLGGEKAITVDVRVVAATNRDIEAQIRSGNFREDLYYRLNGFPLSLPPLRERPEDIGLLAAYFLEKQEKAVTGISQEALDTLHKHSWPGNVRELENAVRRAAILAESDSRELIRRSDLPEQVVGDIASGEHSYIDLETQILEHLRMQAFSRSAITNTAKALGDRDRGTITEYFRGMCFNMLQQSNFDIGEAVVALAGEQGSDEARERLHSKIDRYLQNLYPLPNIDAPDFDPRQHSAFRGLPAAYHPSLLAVIRHLSSH